ncbi:GNAT family N-acetyltransferase [Enterococcus ureasiticus]|uniref:GNAT family N-acetyltransferase n=1 Tax=Enterococcus ureasiticus TaxID=903984 RepID=A0A1E5GQ54_9ENTE|nr:GNAT family N-acetyltransferase [Enterococcus ureasiticus]OEG14370.1 GNAT family N-acetyltransferase [Enterococcus ureasiticus]
MEITLAEPKDFNVINQLFEAAKRQMIQDNIHQWTKAYPNEQIVQNDIRDHLLVKLVDNDKIVAVATLNITREKEYIVRRIATDPNYLSNGYASILLNDIINRAKEKNGKHIYSSTNHSNLKMQHFFKKHGFEKISEYTEIEREHLGSFYKYLKKI